MLATCDRVKYRLYRLPTLTYIRVACSVACSRHLSTGNNPVLRYEPKLPAQALCRYVVFGFLTMIEQRKKPTLFKSKSFSFYNNAEGRMNERKQIDDSDKQRHYSPERMRFGQHADVKYEHSNHQSPTSITGRGSITARVPIKRRKSFMPTTDAFHANEDSLSSPANGRKVFRPTFAVIEMDGEKGTNIAEEASPLKSPSRRRNSFIPAALQGVSLSPKPALKKLTASTLQRRTKPPLLRTLSYSASTDTYATETDHSENTRSAASTPTSTSSSDSQPISDEHSLENISENVEGAKFLTETPTHFDNAVGLYKSSRSTISPQNVDDVGGSCRKVKNETKMNVLPAVSLAVATFLWRYMKAIAATLNLQTATARIWTTLFDIVIEAVSIMVDVMSYALTIMLRIFEASMLWFMQQVYIRQAFIYLYNSFKNRRKSGEEVVNEVDGDPTKTNELPLSPTTEKGNRRPMRFLIVPKDMVRRRSMRAGTKL